MKDEWRAKGPIIKDARGVRVVFKGIQLHIVSEPMCSTQNGWTGQKCENFRSHRGPEKEKDDDRVSLENQRKQMPANFLLPKHKKYTAAEQVG